MAYGRRANVQFHAESKLTRARRKVPQTSTAYQFFMKVFRATCDILVGVESGICVKMSEQAEGRLKVGFKLDSQTIQLGRVNPVRGISVLPAPAGLVYWSPRSNMERR
jgi:hypothetical protein